LEKKMEEAAEPDAEFGLFGLALPGKEHEPLPRVETALSRLLIIVDSSDRGPTADAATASAQWEDAAREALGRWAAFQKDELANANGLLEKAKLKPLVIASTNP
jgi:hypothetical protein